jgi:hypothetical protein
MVLKIKLYTHDVLKYALAMTLKNALKHALKNALKHALKLTL